MGAVRAAAPGKRVITGFGRPTVKVWRGGACERTIQAHRLGPRWRWPGGRACQRRRRTAMLWTPDGALERTFEVGAACLRRGAARRHARGRSAHRQGPAVPRRRTRPHQGHRPGARGGGDARRPAHHQRLGGRVSRWSVATKSRASTCKVHPMLRGGGDARRPANPQRSATRPSACGSSTAPSRTPSSCTPHVNAVALPDNQHALSGSTDRPSSSSTPTTAPSCAPSCTTHAR